MFEPVSESLRKATEATVQMQHELFNKWIGMFPGIPGVPTAFEPMKFQKQCVEVIAELTKKQRELLEAFAAAEEPDAPSEQKSFLSRLMDFFSPGKPK